MRNGTRITRAPFLYRPGKTGREETDRGKPGGKKPAGEKPGGKNRAGKKPRRFEPAETEGGKTVKEYRLVYLNSGVHMSMQKDLFEAEDLLNQYISDGWTLQEMVVMNSTSALVAVMYREKEA